MGVSEKVSSVLIFVLMTYCTRIPLYSGAADIHPIHPKYEESDVSSGIPLSSGVADIYAIHPKYEENEVSSLIEQDTQRIGRRLQAAAKTTFFNMQGNVYPDGIYYVTVFVGHPPKPYFLDVDTGSDLTWLQCDAPCQSCAKTPHQLYKPPPSSVMSCKDPLCAVVQAANNKKYDCSSSKQCDYDIKYADGGSSMGVLVRDNVPVLLTNGTRTWANSAFGCGYDQFGSLAKSPAATDGVLGLSSGPASLPSQWAKQGLIKNVIGLCISGGGKKGGYMFFGDDHVPTSSMTWVPMLGKPTMKYYYAGTAQMMIGNKLLAKGGDEKKLGGIVFDTGSSYTYFTSQAYSSIVSAVREIIGKQLVQDSSDRTLPLCWRGKKTFRSIADVTSYFKPVTFNFRSTSSSTKNIKLEIPPEGYLIISAKGNVCLGILNGTGISTFNILGDISLQGYLVVHDNNNQRIGWARMDCTKPPKSVNRRWALEDPPQLQEGGKMPCAQDLGKAVCSSSLYSLPDFGVLQETSCKAPSKGLK